MPRNGSGTYSLPAGNPVVSGTTIQSTWANSTLNDVGDALTGSVARDGTGGMSGPLRLADGTISIPGLAFASETTTGFSRPTTNAIVASVSAVEKMRINASGVSVSGALSAGALSATSIDINGNVTLSGGTANGVVYLNGSKVATSGSALTFDGTNLGVGVVPSAWTTGGTKAVQLPGGAVVGFTNGSNNNQVLMLGNCFFNTSGNPVYINSDFATYYRQYTGSHSWFTAPSGTAGNVITFTQAMTLDASGNVGIGTASPTFSAGSGVHIYRSSGATLRVQDASTDFDILSFGGNANLLNRSNGALTLGTNNTECMRIAANGAIGIGGANYGTSGQVLTSGGSGAAPSWSALPSASTTAQGIVELATDAEVQTGTDTVRAVTPAGLRSANIMLGTAVASTSGTSIDFTGIPSWAKRVTVMFDGVSTTGSSPIMVQLGDSGGVEITGYASGSFLAQQAQNCVVTQNTTGFTALPISGVGVLLYGKMSIELLSSNTWLCFGAMWQDAGTVTQQVNAGRKALSATLDRVRITTVGGTDTFDAGTINVSWE